MFKKVISYILSFILTLTLTADIILIIISATVLNKSYVLSELSRNSYYSQIYHYTMENFKNNTIQSGLTEDVLDGITSKEKIEEEVKLVIEYIYGEKEEVSVDTLELEEALRANIDKQVKAMNKRIEKDEQEEIDIYVENIVNIYKNEIMYSEKYIKYIPNAINKIKPVVRTSIAVLSIATLALTIFLTLFRKKKKSLKYLSISSLASGMLLILIKILESTVINVNHILIFNQAFSNIIINCIENTMIVFLTIGIILFVLGIFLSIKSRKR